MSGTTEAASATVTRTKDGIPCWGGEASSFVQYEEAALLWEQSLTWEKRRPKVGSGADGGGEKVRRGTTRGLGCLPRGR